jgi:hypothetical protein
MRSFMSFLRSLGGAGATANAYRAVERQRLANQRVDALASRLQTTRTARSA